MAQGSFGRIRCFSDFSEVSNITVINTGTTMIDGGIGLIGVNEGSFASTVDEPGGIIAITTDTGDDDNHALVAGPFIADDGGMQMEARFKIGSVASTKIAVFCGFSETMSRTTPVMPAELATTVLTINGTGSFAGMYFDSEATTIDWRGIASEAGAVLAGVTTPGDRANATITADRWWIVRVEISPAGFATIKFGDADNAKELKVISKNTAALDATANYTAVLMIENRDANAEVLECDYFYANGFRDWSPN